MLKHSNYDIVMVESHCWKSAGCLVRWQYTGSKFYWMVPVWLHGVGSLFPTVVDVCIRSD